ncbi:hypothetical protein E8D34_01085 [Nocardioides sp. GY 10113]|uniref:hypothetical protein n=1 Tax=Nocardioides sp. GY 10113 TaxID=2569761 RepID=UPI0010A8B84F|nr:hypothetical protein [Nocardioides sp. GY 10113]TIC89127.1 hypothetical protein E8D34_01085 [Nocardioides sp. GY 10113]
MSTSDTDAPRARVSGARSGPLGRLGRLGRLARELVLLELALYRSLARWLARRPDVPAGTTAIGYARQVTPLLWLWTFAASIETVVIEVVLRTIDTGWSEAIRLPLLVLGVWGALWMLGMIAAHRVRPHLLAADRLRIRSGARTWVEVPLDRVATVRPAEHELPGLVTTLHVDGDLVLVGVSSRTNVEIGLDGPTTLRTSAGEVTASRVALWVDEPRELVARRLGDPGRTVG